ncbi:hypothetical protein D3C73_1310740 [compost metagenome]
MQVQIGLEIIVFLMQLKIWNFYIHLQLPVDWRMKHFMLNCWNTSVSHANLRVEY